MNAKAIHELIGNTPLLKIPSLSEFTGSDIYLKLEHMNPGGSIKDRAALQMVTDAIENKGLKPGMTIIEGTAGNTGIGLALVGKSLGYAVKIVMPNNQSPAKSQSIELLGAENILVPPKPFKDPEHFYHQAKRIRDGDPNKYWWANQFENTSNYRAHKLHTGPEIVKELPGITHFVSTAGSGGSIAGISHCLKDHNSACEIILVDPYGSGLKSYVDTGEFKSEGGSFTEGIGIMRLVENFKHAKVDRALRINDQTLVSLAYTVAKHDGIVLGLSSSLNLAGAFATALSAPKGSNILTISCDTAERSFHKLYNEVFLSSQNIKTGAISLKELAALCN